MVLYLCIWYTILTFHISYNGQYYLPHLQPFVAILQKEPLFDHLHELNQLRRETLAKFDGNLLMIQDLWYLHVQFGLWLEMALDYLPEAAQDKTALNRLFSFISWCLYPTEENAQNKLIRWMHNVHKFLYGNIFSL